MYHREISCAISFSCKRKTQKLSTIRLIKEIPMNCFTTVHVILFIQTEFILHLCKHSLHKKKKKAVTMATVIDEPKIEQI